MHKELRFRLIVLPWMRRVLCKNTACSTVDESEIKNWHMHLMCLVKKWDSQSFNEIEIKIQIL